MGENHCHDLGGIRGAELAAGGGHDVLYSDAQIANMTGIRRGEIIQAAKDEGFAGQFVNGKWYLTSEELERVLGRVSASMIKNDNYYVIPDHLRMAGSAWSTTLVRMYQEGFACPGSVSPEQGELLWTMVRNLSPKNIVEIGSYIGISTIWMAAALEQLGGTGMTHGIDKFEPITPDPRYHSRLLREPLEFAQSCVNSAQLSHRVKFHRGDSKDIGRNIREVVEDDIDLLFIDGDHTVAGCLSDFLIYTPHVAVGGYIIIHDIYPEYSDTDGPRYVIDHVVKHVPWFDIVEINTNPRNDGLALIRKLA